MTALSPQKEKLSVVAKEKSHLSDQAPTSDRVQQYSKHFVSHAQQAAKPAGFIRQVNGYGVQVFAQAGLFKS